MKSIGFVISDKENEKRRAILPHHLIDINNTSKLFFQTGYGDEVGYKDADYLKYGVNIASFEEILTKDVIIDPKIGDAKYIDKLSNGQTIFGWIHAVQNKKLTDELLSKDINVFAWEDMFNKGRHVFYKNNELAGEAAIIHSISLYGDTVDNWKVALIGKGNVARGAMKILYQLGAKVDVYDRYSENALRDKLGNYNVIVNAVLWDITRDDHIIYRNDLSKLQRPSLIIDISCDKNGAIETSVPTTIEDPTYYIDEVLHYVVDHTPALIPKTASNNVGNELKDYVDFFVESKTHECEILNNALIISNKKIIDEKINKFQKRG